MTPDDIHAFDQALAGTDEIITIAVTEISRQLAEGYKEDDILTAFHAYVTNFSGYSRTDLAVLYVRTAIRLAKSGESI